MDKWMVRYGLLTKLFLNILFGDTCSGHWQCILPHWANKTSSLSRLGATCKALRWNFINYFKQAAQKNQSTDFIGSHIICLCSFWQPEMTFLSQPISPLFPLNKHRYFSQSCQFQLGVSSFGVWTWGSALQRIRNTILLVSEEPCVDHKPDYCFLGQLQKAHRRWEEEPGLGAFFRRRAGKQTLEDLLQDLDAGQRPRTSSWASEYYTGSSAS